MANVVFLSEGDMEFKGLVAGDRENRKGFLQELDKALNENKGGRIIIDRLGGRKIKGGRGKKLVLSKVAEKAQKYLEKHSDWHLFVTCDLYPLLNEGKYIHHNYDELRKLIIGLAGSDYDGRLHPAPFKWEIEAYFYAQADEVNKVMKPSRNKEIHNHNNPEDIDNNDPPSKRLEKHFNSYGKTTDGVLILQRMDPKTVASKCHFFKRDVYNPLCDIVGKPEWKL